MCLPTLAEPHFWSMVKGSKMNADFDKIRQKKKHVHILRMKGQTFSKKYAFQLSWTTDLRNASNSVLFTKFLFCQLYISKLLFIKLFSCQLFILAQFFSTQVQVNQSPTKELFD